MSSPSEYRVPWSYARGGQLLGLSLTDPRALGNGEGPRRLLNVAVAAVGLVLAAPVMVLIALLIKVTSAGPVLFMQTRIGIDLRRWGDAGHNGRRLLDGGGRPFTIYKFRTMAPSDAELQVWAKPDDPRVTALGSSGFAQTCNSASDGAI